MKDIGQVTRVVIKAGSRILAERIEDQAMAMAKDIAWCHTRGIEVAFVSSGAIALGMRRLGIAKRPHEIAELQACAAVGQGQLMQRYDRAFQEHGLAVGQVLITHDDIGNRSRFLSARRTLRALLDRKVVPIINENDTVAVEEIKFGDNDLIAALISHLIGADLLVILTDVAGLLDPDGKLISHVSDFDSQTRHAGGSVSGLGSGGMASKVAAARAACRFGVPTIVTSGSDPDPLSDLLSGTKRGTLFLVDPEERLAERKHWIAYALKPKGTVVIDDGAVRALRTSGKSLLPSGIKSVQGTFELGDPVAITDAQGREVARGLSSYSSDEIGRILGQRTSEIERLLGYRYGDEVIHRDDLVLI